MTKRHGLTALGIEPLGGIDMKSLGTPSMRTVQRFASAVGARAVVRMEPLTGA
jgi:hypothetical protein